MAQQVEALAVQDWQLEVSSLGPTKWEERINPQSCPLASKHMHCDTHMYHTHTHIHNNNK